MLCDSTRFFLPSNSERNRYCSSSTNLPSSRMRS